MAKTKIKLEDKTVELSLLKDFPGNPNVHPIDQIKALAKSIDKYGQYYRIIVDENMNILAGHGKKTALAHKGSTQALVTVISGLSENDKMKLLLEDNKIQSLSYNNFGKIEELIKQIGDTDIIGYDINYLDAIINERKIDNLGTNFENPVEKKEIYTEKTEEAEQTEAENFESGMVSATGMICPHCGKEIMM